MKKIFLILIPFILMSQNSYAETDYQRLTKGFKWDRERINTVIEDPAGLYVFSRPTTTITDSNVLKTGDIRDVYFRTVRTNEQLYFPIETKHGQKLSATSLEVDQYDCNNGKYRVHELYEFDKDGKLILYKKRPDGPLVSPYVDESRFNPDDQLHKKICKHKN